MSGNYLPIVDQKFPSAYVATLTRQLDAITQLYSVVCCNGNDARAAATLRKQQAEQVRGAARSGGWRALTSG